jgi:5'-3' exonuclease
MGLKNINSLFKMYASKGIKDRRPLMTMRNKTIVIDASIYLYKYKKQGALITNIYWMLNLFNVNSITPIFVFDGRPPVEKQHVILQRKKKKNTAHDNILDLNKSLSTLDNSLTESIAISDKIIKEQIKTISITSVDVNNVIELLNAYNISYIHAIGEADAICAQLVLSNVAHACLSDDMDLFLYGTSKVLRNLNLYLETFDEYDFVIISSMLKMTPIEFTQCIILTGSDYNKSYIKIDKVYKLFNEYQQSEYSNFYTWLIAYSHIKETDMLLTTLKLIDTKYPYTIIKPPHNSNQYIIQSIMEKYGFIYPKKLVQVSLLEPS